MGCRYSTTAQSKNGQVSVRNQLARSPAEAGHYDRGAGLKARTTTAGCSADLQGPPWNEKAFLYFNANAVIVEPDGRSTYCLPSTKYVVGGA